MIFISKILLCCYRNIFRNTGYKESCLLLLYISSHVESNIKYASNVGGFKEREKMKWKSLKYEKYIYRNVIFVSFWIPDSKKAILCCKKSFQFSKIYLCSILSLLKYIFIIIYVILYNFGIQKYLLHIKYVIRWLFESLYHQLHTQKNILNYWRFTRFVGWFFLSELLTHKSCVAFTSFPRVPLPKNMYFTA